jgi:hypothetical protein
MIAAHRKRRYNLKLSSFFVDIYDYILTPRNRGFADEKNVLSGLFLVESKEADRDGV